MTIHLAEMVGIETSKHGLIRLKSGELAYLTKRFDRNKTEKIACEDFCKLSENITKNKYRGSIENIGNLVDQHTNTNLLSELYEIDLLSLSL